MCIPPSEVTHTCLLDLDSTASRSRHSSLLCLDPQVQAIRVSPYQICAHQAFACWNRPHRRAPRPPARKTQKSGQPKASHASPHAAVNSEKSTTRRLRFLTSRSCSCTRAAMTASSSTDLLGLRIWCQPLLHAPPRATWVSDFSSTRRNLLLMSSDVIGWHHRSTSTARLVTRPGDPEPTRISIRWLWP